MKSIHWPARLVFSLATASIACGKTDSSPGGGEPSAGASSSSAGSSGSKAEGSGGTVSSGGGGAQGGTNGSAKGGSQTGGQVGRSGAGGDPRADAGNEAGGASGGVGSAGAAGASGTVGGFGGTGEGGEPGTGDCTANCTPEYMGAAPLAWDASPPAVDADGSYFQAGAFLSSRDFDPGPGEDVLTAVEDGELFVSKYSADGAYLWTHTLGRNGNVTLAPGPNGAVFVSGAFTRKVRAEDVDQTALVAEPFICLLDASGELLWQHVFAAITDQSSGSVRAVSEDGHGNTIVTANFVGDVDFDPGAGIEARHSGPRGQSYLFEYDSAGSRLWEQPITSEECGFSPNQAAVSADAIVVAGNGHLGCVIGGKPVGGAEALVAFSRKGILRDVRVVSGMSKQISDLLAFDDGAVVLAGRFEGQLSIDDVVVATESARGSSFIMRLSTGTTPDWVKTTRIFREPWLIARAPAGGVVTYLRPDEQAGIERGLVVWGADGAVRRRSSLVCYTTPRISSNADRFLVASDGDASCEPVPGLAGDGRGPFVARYRF
jgi:hypothetical protein